MKKTLTAVMALVLALSMVASFAFVLNPGPGSAYEAKNSPLNITGFFVTTNDAIKSGARLYSDLKETANPAYAKNEVIRFAITMEVLNDTVPANGVATTKFGPAQLKVTSSTVDFSISNMAGQQALHVPFANDFVNAITSKVNNEGVFTAPDVAAYGAKVENNILTINLNVIKAGTDTDFPTPDKSAFSATDTPDRTISIVGPTGTNAKASYAYIFTGITKGEITEQGLAKLVIDDTDDIEFGTPNDTIKVVKNGRTYYVQKLVDTDPESVSTIKHPIMSTSLKNSDYYNLTKVAYRVYLVGKKTTDSVAEEDTYELTPIAQLDTESVKWATGTLSGEEVEGLGYSLGIETLTHSGAKVVVDEGDPLPNAMDFDTTGSDTALVFKAVLSDGTVRLLDTAGLPAFDKDEQALFDTMMADFGFSTADNYTYKLEDKYFTTAGQELEVLTATYNNGTVVPVETEEETDVEEGTEEEELEEDEDIVEDIDEELEEDDEVPATGDFAADIALALTAAAIVAAAALAFVMKKARD